MRKCLVVGVDFYENYSSLFGCVNDAHSVASVLNRNSDGTVNFDSKLLTGSGPLDLVAKAELRDGLQNLFRGDECETALFYFAGHGRIESTGGYILASDTPSGDYGMPLSEVIALASKSKARNRIVILDSCHSGIAGDSTVAPGSAELRDGLTILAASTDLQYASEENGSGVFTSLLVDALSGAAANLVGEVTPGSIYAHVDQSLGPWDQRPVFKTNVKSFVSLRRVQPPIGLTDLQRIAEFFPDPGFEFALDPTFEPERQDIDPDAPAPDQVNNAIFAILQKYNRVGLVSPVGAPHMWHAAMESKTCRLTVLGEHYRRLVASGRI